MCPDLNTKTKEQYEVPPQHVSDKHLSMSLSPSACHDCSHRTHNITFIVLLWGPWQTRKMDPNAMFSFCFLVAPDVLGDPSLAIQFAPSLLMALQWLGPIALT